MTEVKPGDLRPGDKVRISYVETVDEVSGDWIYGNRTFDLDGAKLELLHGAKPKAGETIRGNQLKDTPWKRGTLIKDSAGHHYALQANGDWRDLTFECNDLVLRETALNTEFHLFSDDEPIELLYVP